LPVAFPQETQVLISHVENNSAFHSKTNDRLCENARWACHVP
jgi:hypothetical protein